MNKKIRMAFIKFGGLAVGGSELWLQKIAANLPKDKYEIDYYYCDSAPYIGSDYKHANTNKDRMKYMIDNKINLIKFNVGFKDITIPTHDWITTNFWQKFNSKKYDLVQIVKAGPKEYPYYLIDLPIVEIVALASFPDESKNIVWSLHSSSYQRNIWLKNGGDEHRSSVLPAPLDPPHTQEDYRKELGIHKDAIIAGFHQRPADNIWSRIPLNAFNKCQNEKWHFIIKGGSDLYKKQAKELKLKNMHFLPSDGDNMTVSKFLNTLDIFAHGREDGETFGAVIAEALIHGKPCISHFSKNGDNAQRETMGAAGLFALDEEDYTKKLYSLLNDSKLRDNLALKAKEQSKQYSIENTIKSVTEIYDKVLNKDSTLSQETLNDIIKTRDHKLKKTYRKSLEIIIKRLAYNKYFLRCYRLFKKAYEG